MSLFDITNPIEKAKAAVAEAQRAKADQHAKGAIDAMNAAVQAAKLAEVQKAMDEATAAATAAAAEAARWKEQEETIEDALEHAGISGVDVQIDGKGYAKLVGSVTSEADRDTAVAMVEQFSVTGMEVALDIPLSAPLIDAYGRDTGFQLIGIVDLLVEDEAGRLTVVDLKTASRAKDPADVDADLQLSGYAELLAANRYIIPTAPLSCRLDVLMKSKTPRLVRYPSTRSADNRLRFLQIACGVLHGIDAGLFLPNRGWLCADCEYGDACKSWHLT